ncbi:MAG: hypothetical protein HY744_13890 [Deltaproteobacteria bacterium]|nr:hypothetical protein [Deltaproteobacteria bacterium]
MNPVGTRPLLSSLLLCAAAGAVHFAACGSDETGPAATAPSQGGTGPGGGGGAGQGGEAGAAPDGGIDAPADVASEKEPYVPDPIPQISEEPAPPCPDQTPPGYFQFLDDTCKAKKLPSHQDRDQQCPSLDESAVIELDGGGQALYQPSSQSPALDNKSLSGLTPDGIDLTVILIRRVGGVPHYRYLSNGTHDKAIQPWSTSKFLAAANAAATLEIASNYKVGLPATVDGTPLGDLVTSVHNYDHDPYSSNALGAYFHNIGGRERANQLIHDLWLGRPVSETFGGNYGEAAPKLGYTFVQGDKTVTVKPDQSSGYANHISTFTLAEAVKRLVLHREEKDQRLPGIQWTDLRVLLYGAEGSAKYGAWGGMTADTAIYLQSGHDIDYLEKRSKGRWTIFSKLGLGCDGQFLNVGYACFPVLDDELQPVPGWSREFVIAAHLPTGGGSWAERDRLLATTYRALITRIVDGRL